MGVLTYFDTRIGWYELIKRTASETIKDDCMSLAAELAYYFFLALFPALLFLIAVASFFPVSDMVGTAMHSLARIAPPEVLSIVRDQVEKISNSGNGGLLTVGMLLTIWSTSAGMVAIISTLNRAYDIEESRPWWKVRLTAIGLTVALTLFIAVSFTLVVVGPTLAEQVAGWFHLSAAFVWTWKIIQWPVVFLLVTLAIAIVYYFAPDAEQDFVWLTPGSLLATLLWLVFSLGFKYYVSNFADYNATYGTIGGIMVLMLWFYASGLAILIGAEMNAEIEHASPYGKAPGEKVPGEKRKIGLAAARAYFRSHKKAEKAFANRNIRPVPPPEPEPPTTGEMVTGGVLASIFAALRGRRRMRD